MALKQPRAATYADLEALPPNMVGEIIFGTLHAQPRPAFRHGRAAARLQTKLGGPFDLDHKGPGGWVFITEPELHLGPHVVVPDIGGWRRERMAELPNAHWTDIAPDWLCEILSPSTQRIDRTDKLAIYASFGVKHCWYVDPIAKTMEVFTLTGDKWLLAQTYKDADPVTAPPFETHTFPLDVLWPSDSA
jgi:Uma2 family endonuclease